MEKLVEAKVYKVMQFCDECGEELVFTGEVLTSNPAKYVHRCPKCGNIEWLSTSYPCIEYR